MVRIRRTGALVATFDGVGPSEQLGSKVALLDGAVALSGRGPDTADNGIVRVFPR